MALRYLSRWCNWKQTPNNKSFGRFLLGSAVGLFLMLILLNSLQNRWGSPGFDSAPLPVPLVMRGGDPYIRALMRTISASESLVSKPYSVLYGGKYVANLNQHPDICVTIVTGPNKGDCTTAAGRYQMLSTTWYEMAQRYHPHPSQFLFWRSYSFEPEFQDAVVYAWLRDSTAWDADISQLLRQNKVNDVLRLLSPTWTSLGYGIEDNSMSDSLPNIYQKMLQEELKKSKQNHPK